MGIFGHTDATRTDVHSSFQADTAMNKISRSDPRKTHSESDSRIVTPPQVANPPVSFGIATAPQQFSYVDVLGVWQEADTIPQIEHEWLFDHLLPIGGDPSGPIFEGWNVTLGPRRTDRAAAALATRDQQPVSPTCDAGQDRRNC